MGFLTHLFIFSELLFCSCALTKIPGSFWISFGLWMAAALWHVVDRFLSVQLGIRLSISHLAFLSRPSSFWSSAKQLKIGSFLFFLPGFIVLISWGLLYSELLFRRINPLFPLFFALASGALCAVKNPTRLTNPLFLIQRDLILSIVKRFKKTKSAYIPRFPQEKNQFLSKEYPLLRVTTAFKGQKLFSLSTKDKPHLIFVVLESFRAKNVGCLGAKVPLTPHFDNLAKQGILFSNFHSTSNFTNRSIIASLFGVLPAHLPWQLKQYCDIPMRGLPQILEEEGYHNALIQGGSLAFDHDMEFFQRQGYQTILGKTDIPKISGSSWGIDDEYLMPFAASWLSKQNKATFLTLFTITNHHPWIAPASWKQLNENPYLNTLAYTDWSLSIFVEELKRKGLLEKSVLFIFGDHGQRMAGGNPYRQYNRHLYQDNIHVPLLIYAEGRLEKPMCIETASSQVDILPTVLDLFQIQSSHHSVGKSLLRTSSAPIFFNHPFDSPILGCRKEQWKLLLQDSGEELYDLSADPEEETNVAREHPSIVQDLKKQTIDHIDCLDNFYKNRLFIPETKRVCERETGPHVFRLDFSNSLRMTDEHLDRIAQDCPNLAELSLSDCILISDIGIASLFKHCPRLEALNIKGLDELTGEGWPPAPNLFELQAQNCPRLGGGVFIEWLKSLPCLHALYLGCGHLPDDACFSLSKIMHNLTRFLLSDCQITDRGLTALLRANFFLEMIWIHDCPEISDTPFLALQEGALKAIQCLGCPQVTEAAPKYLSTFPSLTLQIGPRIL